MPRLLQPAAAVPCDVLMSVGALERNLFPLVESEVLQQVAAKPVQVAVSGVAFPHPEKVRNMHVQGEDRCWQ